MNIGVVGDEGGFTQLIVFKILDFEIRMGDKIVSGDCIGVDKLAEKYHYHRGLKDRPIIHKPLVEGKKWYFMRNQEIARDSKRIIAFIKRGSKKSGAFNTLRHFMDMEKFDFSIYDEYGIKWLKEEYPVWIKERFRQYLGEVIT